MLTVFGLVFALVFAAIFYFSQTFILRGAGWIEREQVVAALNRAETVLRTVVDDVDEDVRDRAWRPDPSPFLADGSQGTTDATTSESAWLPKGINAAAFLAPDGGVVRGAAYDSERRVAGSLPAAFLALLGADSPLRRPKTRDDGSRGLLMTEAGPIIVAARAVVSHPGEASRGILVMGRRLGEIERRALGKATGLDIRFESAFPGARLTLAESMTPVPVPGGEVFLGPTREQTIGGAALIKDVAGRPALLMRVTMPRTVSAEAERTVLLFAIALTAMAMISFMVCVSVLNYWVLARVSRLGTELAHIEAQSDPTLRVDVGGHDELTRLAGAINSMLASLERARDMSEAANRTLRVISESNQALIRAIDETGLPTELCRIIVETGGYPCAWIAFCQAGSGALRCVAQAGSREDLLAVSLTESALGKDGPAALAAETGVPRVWRQGESASGWAQAAARAGVASVLAIPIPVQGGVLGVVVVASSESTAFGDEETGLLAELARDVSHGIAALRTGERLRQAQKMEALGRLAGGIAHDFNNLLTAIIGFARLIRDHAPDGGTIRDDAGEIVQAGERATVLAKRMLTLSRKQMVQMGPVDVNAVAGDFDRLLRRTLGEDVELVTVLGDVDANANADVGLIEQVLLNLALNAREAMPSGGKLTIQTGMAAPPGWGGHAILLLVKDTGCGMGVEVRERAFEPFFTTRRHDEHAGLGLSSVYGIVQQCGGQIELESEVGKGTEVRIYLPCCAEALPPKTGMAASGLRGGTERILVVEDEDTVRRLTVRLLKSIGYRVVEVRNGAEALRLYEQHPAGIDLILTDIVMPQLGGPELVDELRRRGYRFRVLYMTGFSQDTIIRGSMAGREVPVVLKPYSYETLAGRVREVLDEPEW